MATRKRRKTIRDEDSLAVAADQLANAIGRPTAFDSPKMKYLRALGEPEQEEDLAKTLDQAIDQMLDAAKRTYGVDLRAQNYG